MDNNKLKKKTIRFIFIAIVFLCIIVFDHIKDTNGSEDVSNEPINNESSIVEVVDASDGDDSNNSQNVKEYTFRSQSQLDEHFEKHGEEMGYKSAEDYLTGANAVINNSKALHKLEAEDNDHIYYIEDTNEIVFLSQDGYIRTFFVCSGKAYYDRQ